jgi:hypothetical protein
VVLLLHKCRCCCSCPAPDASPDLPSFPPACICPAPLFHPAATKSGCTSQQWRACCARSREWMAVAAAAAGAAAARRGRLPSGAGAGRAGWWGRRSISTWSGGPPRWGVLMWRRYILAGVAFLLLLPVLRQLPVPSLSL